MEWSDILYAGPNLGKLNAISMIFGLARSEMGVAI